MGIVRLDSADDPRVAVYKNLTDRQLRSRLEPACGVLVAESEKVVRVALAAGLQPFSLLLEERQLESQSKLIDAVLAAGPGRRVGISAGHIELAEETPEPEVYVLPHEEACKLVGYNVTRGVLCAMRRPLPPSASELLATLPEARRVAVFEGVTDSTNMGAAFRSAAALNVDAILLSPTCCDPLVRRSVRVSMGTLFQVPWGRMGAWPCADDAADGLGLLRAQGFTCAALALRDDSYALGDPELHEFEKLAMVFGTEGDGLAQATIDACDLTIKIPMSHGVDSLNVAAASAVTFWELCR